MARPDHPFFPHHVVEQVLQLLLILGVLFALAMFLPAALEEKADPLVTPAHVKPEWYFLAQYQLLKIVPRALGIIGMGVAVVIIIAFPLILDRGRERRRPLARKFFFFGGLAFILAYIAFTAWGRYS